MKEMDLDHRTPIILKENMSYHVVSGVINLFLVKKSENPLFENRRVFLLSVSEGSTILGRTTTYKGACYDLIAVGSAHTNLQIDSLDSLKWVNEGIIKWLTNIDEQMNHEKVTKLMTLSQSELIKTAKQTTFEYLEEKVDSFYIDQELMKAQYEALKKAESNLLNQAVLFLKSDEEEPPYPKSGSSFFKVCQFASSHLNIEITDFKAFSEKDLSPHLLLITYFQKMNLKYRKLNLEQDFWKKNHGVIIALKTSNDPIVLLPHKKTGYQLFDLELGTSMRLNETLAKDILKDAYMIYRTFPEKEIKGIDLIKFALKSIKSGDIALFFFSVALIGILGMAIPLLTGLIVDFIIPQGNYNLLSQMVFLLLVVALTSFLFNLARGFITLRIEGQLDLELQTAIWDRLLHLPLGFFKQFTSAELATRALGITMIRDIVSGPVIAMILTGVYSIFSFLVLFYYNILLAIIVTLMTLICITVNYKMSKKILSSEYSINEINNTMAGLTFQIIKGAIKIQHSGATERAFYKWAEYQSKKHNFIKEKGLIVSKMEAFNGIYLPLTMAIIYYLITMNPTFYLPVGHFIGFNAAYLMFTSAIISIFGMANVLSQVIPLYNRGKIILGTLPECLIDKTILSDPSGKISVDHVAFKYSTEGPEILKDISLEIKAGEYVGVVGTSGSGKSTLLRLLLGFEASQKGKISFDDKDINNLDLKELRKRIGVVLQSGKLINDSIFHNIVGANLHLTIEDAWVAAKIAGIDQDIKDMPMGMHTFVIEGAGTISGGQRQRILIARALVNKPKILFFDEATSALDNLTQAKIKRSLDQFSATRVVIAHRLSTVKNCDRIIVLDQGTIKEKGTYEELMTQKGVFFELAKRQLA
jgi:NHLM bacteriocin system ABC transporter ATP-binding protein